MNIVSKQRLFYSFPQIDRLGHLATEPMYLRNMFPQDQYEYHFFIPPVQKQTKMNRAVFDIATRGANLIETEDDEFLFASFKSGLDVGLVEQDGDLYVMYDGSQFHNEFVKFFRSTPLSHFSELSAEEKSRGKDLERRMGIPDGAPVVTMNVRERGFHANLPYHSFRNADIENYVAAVEYLLNLGIFVVRIGDKLGKQLHGLPGNFIDAPFHPCY